MLQAWERACILILAAAAGLAQAAPAAQDETPAAAAPEEQRDDPPADLPAPPAGDALRQDAATDDSGSYRNAVPPPVAKALAAADLAFGEGRIDQPPGDCAWFHYRTALDLDPGNEAAVEGLRRVEQDMIDRALDFAHELDFDNADRLLGDALQVREEHGAVDAAQAEVQRIRMYHADQLETEVLRAMKAGDFGRAERLLIDIIALGDMDSTVRELRRRLQDARMYGGLQPGQVVHDPFLSGAARAPDLVVVAAGSFLMGSPASERGREEWEGPEHRVTFRRGFLIGRTEITVGEFRQFSRGTGFRTEAEREGHSTIYDHHSGRLTKRNGVTWEMDYEGREAHDEDPVIHVSWHDAAAYAQWLAQATGKPYRLPSEAEFEYALRAGNRSRYWWGDGTPPRTVENLTGEGDVSRNDRQWSTFFEGYVDRHWGPAPAGSFEANPFGLHDIGGNVAEWVLDCWHDTYLRAPTDGSAWINPGCKLRVVRGGYWASSPDHSRSAFRISADPDRHDARIGFRVARDL